MRKHNSLHISGFQTYKSEANILMAASQRAQIVFFITRGTKIESVAAQISNKSINVNAYRDSSQAYTWCVPAGLAPVRIPSRSFPF